MNRERWLALLIGVAAVIAVLILLWLIERVGAEQKPETCMDEQTRERIRTLSLDGYDQALREHTANLFKIWVQDSHDQPRRAQVGTQSGISAYVRARSFAMKWEPPLC